VPNAKLVARFPRTRQSLNTGITRAPRTRVRQQRPRKSLPASREFREGKPSACDPPLRLAAGNSYYRPHDAFRNSLFSLPRRPR